MKNTMKIFVCALLCGAYVCAQVINTVAGTNFSFPGSNFQALNAPLGPASGVAVDTQGNVYIADGGNDIVVKITPGGVLTIVAGNGSAGFSGDGGPAVSASLSLSYSAGTYLGATGLAVDASGNLYIADGGNNRIRMVSNGIMTTVAGNGVANYSGDGGPAIGASLSAPAGVALDAAGNLYIADAGNSRIRKVSAGTISTIAGTGSSGYSGDGGTALSASIGSPQSIAIDAAGNYYISDFKNKVVRKVSSGTIATISVPSLNGPEGIAVDASGNVYVANSLNETILNARNGAIIAGNGTSGFSGDGELATSASLGGLSALYSSTFSSSGAYPGPMGIAADANGNIYIADTTNYRVRKVAAGVITTIAGDGGYHFSGDGGEATSGSLNSPSSVAVDTNGNIYVADPLNNRIRMISNGVISTVAGNGTPGFSGDGGSATSASLQGPSAIVLDHLNNLIIADTLNNRVRMVAHGVITTIAGGGTAHGDGGIATNAALSSPRGLCFDSESNLYIADSGDNRVRKVSGGYITTVAGNGSQGSAGDGGSPTSAELNNPSAVAADEAGNIYIADQGNGTVREVTQGITQIIITTIAGGGTFLNDGQRATTANIRNPTAIILAGGYIYVADSGNERIRRFPTAGGTIVTVAGNGNAGFSGDGGLAVNASFNQPTGVFVDSAGNIYIADTNNNRVREVFANNATITYHATPSSLNVSAFAGGGTPATQTINLTSAIAGLSFTVASNQPWLTVSPTSGSIPSVLTVSISPGSLGQGSYSGMITITVPNATPTSSTVPIALTLNNSAPPALGVSTQNISFTATQGSGALSQQLQVIDTGGGTVPFTANATTSSGGGWLSISAKTGTATESSPLQLTVTATPGALAIGTYSGAVTIVGASGTIKVPVTLSVSAPTAVALTSQTGLSFTTVAQGGVPLPQIFGILNTGQGAMSWNATTNTLQGGSWLQISPASGTVQQPYVDVSPVTVSINPSGLAAGVYYGQIQIAAAAINSPQLMTVILTVLPSGLDLSPQLYPTGLIFTGAAGATPGSQQVMIGNPTGQPNNFQSGQIGTGFTFQPTNASIQPNQPTVITVYPDFSKLSAGSISRGTITLQFSDGSPSQTVNVLFVVAPSGAATADRTTAKNSPDTSSSGCVSQPLQVQYRAPELNFSALTGQSTAIEVQVTDGCGNLVGPQGQNATVTANFADGEAAQSMTHIGSGIWQVGWKPVKTGLVVITVTAILSQGGLQFVGGISSSLSGTVSNPAAPNPSVTAQGVVHAASDLGGIPIAPGELITVYGDNLANGVGENTGLPLPVLLSGTQVLLGNQPLPILYTNSGQLNVQVPYSVPVNTSYQLTVQYGNTLSVPQSLVVAQAQPGIFTANQQGTGQGSITAIDGSLVQPGSPANIGDTVVIYCTGLGAVSPAVKEGTPAPSTPPLAQDVSDVTVTIGGQPAQVSFAGLAPGFAGLYQINVVVPAGITTGDAVPVVLTIAGQVSPAVTMAVQ